MVQKGEQHLETKRAGFSRFHFWLTGTCSRFYRRPKIQRWSSLTSESASKAFVRKIHPNVYFAMTSSGRRSWVLKDIDPAGKNIEVWMVGSIWPCVPLFAIIC